MLHRIRHQLRRRAAAAPRDGELPERIDSHAVERQRLCRRIGALARPDRRLDRPGLDDRHVDAPRRELDAERVGHRLERELRHRIRAEQRQRVQPRDRAHVDHPSARRTQRREAELRHPQLPHDVHLDLAAKLVRRQELERARNRNACVVQEPVERVQLQRRRIRHVDEHLLRPFGRGAFPAHACEHTPASVAQAHRARRPDSGRCARDEDGLH
jgi:hypothetical protein